MKLLLPIKKEYAQRIISGEKRYEYRKINCTHNIESLLLYCTAPVKKVVAEVEVLCVFKGSPAEIWDKTKGKSGITKDKYFDYYKNKNYAVAFSLGKVKVLDPEKQLSDYGVLYSPQSYVYIMSE